jgi:hypothetical protein
MELNAKTLKRHTSVHPRSVDRTISYFLDSLAKTGHQPPDIAPMPDEAAQPSSDRGSTRQQMKPKPKVAEKRSSRMLEALKVDLKEREPESPARAEREDPSWTPSSFSLPEGLRHRAERRASLKAVREGAPREPKTKDKRKAPPSHGESDVDAPEPKDPSYPPKAPPKKKRKVAATEEGVAGASRKKLSHVTQERLTVRLQTRLGESSWRRSRRGLRPASSARAVPRPR